VKERNSMQLKNKNLLDIISGNSDEI